MATESKVVDKYLTIKDVCDELSVSQATLKNWIKLEKLFPDKVENNKDYLFLSSRVFGLKQAISDGTNSALKSRRNKTYVSGNSIYKSYISEGNENYSKIQNLLNIFEINRISLSDDTIMLLVAECAIQLYMDRTFSRTAEVNLLYKFLSENLDLGAFTPFVEDLIVDKDFALDFVRKNPELFAIDYKYEYGEDILGLLYISTKNIGTRKAMGAYYTPTKIVNCLVDNLFIDLSDTEKTIFDPCCGTGNFLIRLPKTFGLGNIYANDIDLISAAITRINLALHFENYDYGLLVEHVTNEDYFSWDNQYKFDYIVGNPPWGYKFSTDEQKYLKNGFKTAQGKNIESFDVVIEQSLKFLKTGGVLSFVVPESILNVKSHRDIRKILADCCEFRYLEYLGNAFDNVQCPAIIVQFGLTERKMNGQGLRVKDGKREFVLSDKREVSSESFSFRTNDEEYHLVTKLFNTPNCTTLKDNAIFALGIVTGNNTDYIEHEKREGNEIILKGSDIYKYGISSSKNYISYNPKSFQQVAPTEYYRAKEKLFYRFICNRLVFAYDNEQILSLNSCNILIPQIKGLNIKYIMAVLNSGVCQFIHSKHFNSIKILRSHLEVLPIPVIDFEAQQEIIQIVDKLPAATSSDIRQDLYNKIEEKMFEIYGLSECEKKLIIKETSAANNFLL